MKTSRAAIFHGANHPFTLESIVLPPLREGEILVRNEYTTLCRSDLNTFCGKRTEKTPTILGHEIVGVIEEFGPNAPAIDCRGHVLREGDRITWAIYASDPNSAMAMAGIPQKAPGLFKYGHEKILPDSHLHGGLADHCILRRHTPVIRISAAIPLPVLALINCSVATVAGALRLAGSVAGRDVLITGAGMLGVIGCAGATELVLSTAAALALCAPASVPATIPADAMNTASFLTGTSFARPPTRTKRYACGGLIATQCPSCRRSVSPQLTHNSCGCRRRYPTISSFSTYSTESPIHQVLSPKFGETSRGARICDCGSAMTPRGTTHGGSRVSSATSSSSCTRA